MILSLSILFIFFTFWMYTYIKNNEYQKVYGINALLLIIIFIGPAIFYLSGGEAYKVFSNNAIIKYHYLGSFIFLVNTGFLLLRKKLFFNKITPKIDDKALSKFSLPVKIYFGTMFLGILIYILMYLNEFPLIVFIQKHIVIERPDGTGAVPHFYTMSTIMMMVFPSVFFFLYDNLKKNWLLKTITFMSIILFMTIAGHKGIVVFFFIFIWFYVFKLRINLKLIGLFVVSIIIYAVAKGETELSGNNLLAMLHSSFGRMFVTQGAGLIERIHLISIDYIFSDIAPIKNQVCSLVYDVKLNMCSMPTYFIGDIIVNYGYTFALFIYTIIGIPLFYIFNIIDKYFPKSVFIKWSVFMSLFLFSMAEISIFSLLRLFAIIINVIIIYHLSKTEIVKKGKSYKIIYNK